VRLLGSVRARRLVDLYCKSFHRVPERITLDIDDTFDAVHGGQQLRLFKAHHDEYMIVGIFLVAWLLSYAVYRIKGYDEIETTVG